MSSDSDITDASDVHPSPAVRDPVSEAPNPKDGNVNVATEEDSTHGTTKDPTTEPKTDEADRPSTPGPASGAADTEKRSLYPPNDARAMSPRRTREETEQMGLRLRAKIQGDALILQTSLLEIAESIELARFDNEKLERQNLALQDYIGGLTRSMSANDIGGLGKGKK